MGKNFDEIALFPFWRTIADLGAVNVHGNLQLSGERPRAQHVHARLGAHAPPAHQQLSGLCL